MKSDHCDPTDAAMLESWHVGITEVTCQGRPLEGEKWGRGLGSIRGRQIVHLERNPSIFE